MPRRHLQQRGPALLQVAPGHAVPPGVEEETPARVWLVRQVVDDPSGHHDWVIEATVDLDASDETGEAVVMATAMRRL